MLPRKPSTIFHVVFMLHHAIANCAATLISTPESSDVRVIESQNYKWRYFTTWNMTSQVLYVHLALVNDYRTHIGKNSSSWQNFEKYLSYYFTCIVAPLAYFCAFIYWSLYYYDSEQVFPIAIEDTNVRLLNHCVHTNIIVAVIGEMIAAGKPIVLPSFKKGFLYINIYYWIYTVQFVSARVEYGKWMYWIYNELSSVGIVGLILLQWAVLMVICVLSFKVQTWLNRKLKVD